MENKLELALIPGHPINFVGKISILGEDFVFLEAVLVF